MAAQSSINKTILPNGVRMLSEWVPYVDSVSVGIWIEAGARDEELGRLGTSHFLEHMLFKGTERRAAPGRLRMRWTLGGHLNAFTDKEFTCYYAKVLGEHLPKALDVTLGHGAELRPRSDRDRAREECRARGDQAASGYAGGSGPRSARADDLERSPARQCR